MRKSTPILLLLALILASCNLPANNTPVPSPTFDIVSTQVSEMLTQTLAASPTLPATQTPAPTATPQPSATQQITATATATTNPNDPSKSLGKPTWSDNLETAKNFYLYESDNTRIEAQPNALKLTGRTANGWHGWTLTYIQKPTNFYLEGSFQTHECKGTDLYGLIFRAGKENTGYFFGATCDGHYNLYARDFKNNVMTKIIALKEAKAINPGSEMTNRLGVMAQGTKIGLYANGTLLEEINDATFTDGYFGPFVAANETPDFKVELNQINLWALN